MKSLPKNWSKVAGVPTSESGRYLMRGDWIGPVKEYHIYQENQRWWNDYFENTGLTPQDIAYPYRSGYYSQVSGENLYGYAQSVISKNLWRLYK